MEGLTVSNYEVNYLNVQDADAIIIRYEDDLGSFIVLVDAGNVSDSEMIKKYIFDRWRTYIIDLAICTHPDSDHKGGFFGLLQDPNMYIKEFWLISPADAKENCADNRYNCFLRPSSSMCFDHPTDESVPNLITLANKHCGKVLNVYAGHKHSTLPIVVVGPTKEFYRPVAEKILENYQDKRELDEEKYSDEGEFLMEQAKSSIDNEPDDDSPTNAGSLILLFQPTGHNSKFLLLGDANRLAIMDAMSNFKGLSGSNIKVPHHGSKHNLTSQIIDDLAPTCAIISAKGTRKHPSRGVVHCLSKHCNVYSTHVSGGLAHVSYKVLNPATPLKEKQK